MTQPDLTLATVPFSALSASDATPFHLEPDADTRRAIADRLGLLGLRKLRWQGTITAEGPKGWRVEGTLGATVVQPCVVTLEPVTTRLDTPVTRRFLPQTDVPDAGSELEMPEDETIEPLGHDIPLAHLMEEALALALPDYPRAGDAALDQATFAAPGVTPMSDDDTKPFAALKALTGLHDKKDD